ncbi:TetR/AcrR family transcriptional regulator [Pseudomonas saliphila]|uniref:TetR/AcrR family transcriptional regulator n=1 Tax=Pseudomonas saliphila TaxID=2586906 RepID=UPI001238CDE2|nr:TetR/AcrR family transcriptional regulator [Pseudomonas saliphila]
MTSRSTSLRRQPSQSRAEVTLRAIREACLKILEEEGLKRLTTNRIAEVAGVSIGSLYQYYADKHAIAADICNELLMSELGEVNRLDQQTLLMVQNSLEDTIAFFVREYIARHQRLYRKLKDFYLEMHWHYNFEHYVRRRHPRKLRTVDWLPSALEQHRESINVSDPLLAATMVVNTLEGTLHATLDHNPTLIFEPAFEREMVALILSYLKFANRINFPSQQL